MVAKIYKLVISLSWLISAALAFFVAYSLWPGSELGLVSPEGNSSKHIAIYPFALGILFFLTAVGVFWRKRFVLVIVIPYLLFSIFYAYDQIFGEYVWAKYVYQSIFMLLQCGFTIHFLIIDGALNRKRHQDA